MNGWKVFSIVLILVVVAETSIIVLAYKAGSDYIEKENICVINICSGNESDAYSFDEYTSLCSCYSNGLTIHEEIIP